MPGAARWAAKLTSADETAGATERHHPQPEGASAAARFVQTIPRTAKADKVAPQNAGSSISAVKPRPNQFRQQAEPDERYKRQAFADRGQGHRRPVCTCEGLCSVQTVEVEKPDGRPAQDQKQCSRNAGVLHAINLGKP